MRDRALRFLIALPSRSRQTLLRAALHRRNLVLCMHRLREPPRRSASEDELSYPPAELDRMITLLAPMTRSLLVTSDDGYSDAIAYVHERARRFPNVRFGLFLCPEKIASRGTFVWDTAPSELASVAACREAAAHPNVFLGNHTDRHESLGQMSETEALAELEASTRRFEALFGKCLHFAYPFGTPGKHTSPRTLAWLEERGIRAYSTEERTVAAQDTLIPARKNSDAIIRRIGVQCGAQDRRALMKNRAMPR